MALAFVTGSNDGQCRSPFPPLHLQARLSPWRTNRLASLPLSTTYSSLSYRVVLMLPATSQTKEFSQI